MIAQSGYDNWLALILSGLALIYLVLVLIFPERF